MSMTRAKDDAGKVVTVLGPVAPESLGRTLVHEHVFIDLRHASFVPPPAGLEAIAAASTSSIEQSVLARYSCSVRDNLVLDDATLAAEELGRFAAAGGGAVVDVTPPDIGRAPEALQGLAEKTGVTIVMGCGHYCEIGYRNGTSGRQEVELEEEIIRDLLEGVGGIRAGIVGELGVNGEEHGSHRLVGEMTASERRVLRAGARAARQTGAPMTVHLPSRASAVPAVIEALEEVDAPFGRISLSHMDSIDDFTRHEQALERGLWIQYDCFGMALENDWYRDPGDDVRCDWLERHRTAGRLDRVLVSHDVWCKAQLRAYGGAGYDHLLAAVAPALRGRGFSDGDLDQLLVENPARFLAWEEAE
jgi:phosphotriesterase-related protein